MTEKLTQAEMEEKEAEREDLLENETDLLNSLLEAHNYKQEKHQKIDIIRDGKRYFSFSVKGIDDETQEAIRKKYTSIEGKGRKQQQKFDGVGFSNSLIYNATIDEDKQKLWNNKELRKQLDVLSPADVVGAVLLSGEKDRVGEVIHELSGFNDDYDDPDVDPDLDLAKN
ncbi:phage tail assembly chaperone [Geomicrobium sediminis]|uniref:Phage XkdN-like protein n=1 Tax=Geomicrobium sediminis TaxID=1347788 RepID=A0ABS2PEI2_9BACL|nr:hypothetical protein [Geomicrobium sediminis]MBM7633828.1 hypothetical protein [Geomicrobium sediminis]